ncbi:peptidoglycan DD-metalloendopeptidase family protein [Citricoccus sp. GCM10030269]|uniref:peptidoglycan DD-metalloendopeptidase family protein n=1 Tax=Citricoccus sp. GCM10030269 TaxID=3273388 RepID=UPI003623EA66
MTTSARATHGTSDHRNDNILDRPQPVRRFAARVAAMSATAVVLGAGFVGLGATPASAETGAMIMPTSGSITGTPNGYCRSGNSHEGFDIAAPTGRKVVAAADGKVVTSDYASSPGNRVVVDHASGWETRYLHLNSKSVSVGQTVKKGQTVGYVGSTGGSTGPHLHFQIERNDVVVRDGSLLNDFTCGSTVTSGRAINYAFPGLSGGSSGSVAYPKLREGDRGEAVTQLQNALKNAGVNPGTIDGVFGTDTKSAVRSFPSKVGTGVDGVVGPKTWGALVTYPANETKLRNGSTGTQVIYLQRGLKATTGINLATDGKFGSNTESALRQYQSSRNLESDGVAGPNTWNALKKGQ